MSSTLKGKRILVTGGAGFIGSNLCEYFIRNNEVVCLDNLSTGYKRNIKHLLFNDKFSFVEGDICDETTCREVLKGVDIVFHQAALGSVPRSIKDPITTNRNNIDGFLTMLVAAKDSNVERFIYAASSSTYGDHDALPKVEDQIGAPLSPYAITKYVNELYAKVFGDLYGMKTIGLRYFNVFGRRQDPNGAYAAVIPKFFDLLIKNESPTINGDGTQTRDFTYIDNVIHANECAAVVQSEEAFNEVYNVAFGESTSLNELIDIIKASLKNEVPSSQMVPVIHGPNRVGDIPHSLASINKARKVLGYSPEHDISSGIQLAKEYYIGEAN